MPKLIANRPTIDDVIASFHTAPRFLAELGLDKETLAELGKGFIGRGHYAQVFRLPDGMILKVTDDPDDASAAEVIRRANAEGEYPVGLPFISDVKRFREKVVENETDADEERYLYAIVYELVLPMKTRISAQDRAGLRDLMMRMLKANIWGMGYAAEVFEADEDQDLITRIRKEPELATKLNQIMQGLKWLHERGFDVFDLHAGNFGEAAGGRAVIFDFGHGSASSLDVPTIEAKIAVAKNPRVPSLLFHGTSTKQLDRLRADGYIAKDLYVGDSIENIAWHYAETASEEDGSEPVALHLDERVLRRVGKLVPDFHGEDEQVGQWIYTGPLREAIVRVEGLEGDVTPNGRPSMRPSMPNVCAAFDECFDVVQRDFPDFGELELHQDEKAGSDNGHGSERQFGYCKDGNPIRIAFARKTEKLPVPNIRGLVAHEFGHAIDFRYGDRLGKMLGHRLPAGIERRADAIATAVFGRTIKYDSKDVQCVQCQGVSVRPRRLGA